MNLTLWRGRSARRHLNAIGGFTGITIALLLTSLVSVPTLIAFLGSSAWANISVVQAVAGVATVVILFGWGVTGPAQVAAMNREHLSKAYRDSLIVRSVLLVLVAPIAVVIACVSSGLGPVESLIGTLAYLLPSLGASWVFIGVASARLMFLLDAGPRIVANLIGLLGAAVTHSASVYLIVQLVGGIVLVVASSLAMRRRFGAPGPLTTRDLRETIRQQSSGVLSAIAGSAYTSLPVIFVGVVGGPRRDEILLAFRVLRISVTASGPLTQYLQGWAPRQDGGGARRLWRIRTSIKVAGAAAVVATLVLALILPLLSALISRGQILVSYDVAVPIAIAVGAIIASQTTGLVCLVALGRVRAVALSTVSGAVVGVLSLFLLHALADEPGVAWSVAIAELVVVAYQVVALQGALRSLGQEARSRADARRTAQFDRDGDQEPLGLEVVG